MEVGYEFRKLRGMHVIDKVDLNVTRNNSDPSVIVQLPGIVAHTEVGGNGRTDYTNNFCLEVFEIQRLLVSNESLKLRKGLVIVTQSLTGTSNRVFI